MPNWTFNAIFMKDIENLPIFSVDSDGTNQLDFEKLIPTPLQVLSVDCGGFEDEATAWYATHHGMMPMDDALARMLDGLRLDNFPDLCGLKFWQKKLEAAKNLVSSSQISDIDLYNKGHAYYRNAARFDARDWYDWRIKNWGTKWNADNTIINPGIVEFMTAWSAPIPIIKRLSENYPDVPITVRWENEDYDGNHEQMWLNGIGGRISTVYNP